MNDKEYNDIRDRMKFILNVRNTLLTFSFMAVLTVLGIAFSASGNNEIIIYLLPFFVIIPFTGRITYYRIWEAHMISYMQVYRPDLASYEIHSIKVNISRNWIDSMTSWLVNYEMFSLSLACTLLFFIKYNKPILKFDITDWIYCAIPILLSLLTFIIISSAYKYDKMKSKYIFEWEKAAQDSDDINNSL